jgi:thiosulfate dehydrogenase [quinone] large subunit
MKNVVTNRNNEAMQNFPVINKLLNNPLMGIIFLPIRVWLGYEWITAALHKLESPAWMVTGTALKGFWSSAIAIPATGNPPINYAWYRAFLEFLLNTNSYVWFAKLIPVGELLVGLGLILGMFTGFAAFFGGFMNWNFMMAGSLSVNPLYLAVSLLLIAGWKVAGYFGVDYFLIPWVGTLYSQKPEPIQRIPEQIPSGAGD